MYHYHRLLSYFSTYSPPTFWHLSYRVMSFCMPLSQTSAASPFDHCLTASFTSSLLLKHLATKNSFMLGTSENHLGPNLDCKVDDLRQRYVQTVFTFWTNFVHYHYVMQNEELDVKYIISVSNCFSPFFLICTN